MLDYRGLAALHMVIEQQSFEAAASALCITQSAISQRVKSLEAALGSPLLVRKQPYQPTELGAVLLGHYRKTKQLEDICLSQIAALARPVKISIAINRDSLETWFQVVLQRFTPAADFLLEVKSDDQEITIDYLRSGLVSACLSTSAKPVMGCDVISLGHMDYWLVCSPEFKARYFVDNKHKQNLLAAPALLFDEKDTLNARYLKKYFQIENHERPYYHYVPSVRGFREFALQGYGYALIPKIDILDDVKQGTLIPLFPRKVWQMPLYWHTQQIQSALFRDFNACVIQTAKERL